MRDGVLRVEGAEDWLRFGRTERELLAELSDVFSLKDADSEVLVRGAGFVFQHLHPAVGPAKRLSSGSAETWPKELYEYPVMALVISIAIGLALGETYYDADVRSAAAAKVIGEVGIFRDRRRSDDCLTVQSKWCRCDARGEYRQLTRLISESKAEPGALEYPDDRHPRTLEPCSIVRGHRRVILLARGPVAATGAWAADRGSGKLALEIVALRPVAVRPCAWRTTSYPAWRCLSDPYAGLRSDSRANRSLLTARFRRWRPSGHFTSPRSAAHAPATAGHRRRHGQRGCAEAPTRRQRSRRGASAPSRPVLSRRRLRRPRRRQSETGPQGARGFEGRCAVGLCPALDVSRPDRRRPDGRQRESQADGGPVSAAASPAAPDQHRPRRPSPRHSANYDTLETL